MPPVIPVSSVAIRYGMLTGLVSIICAFLAFIAEQAANQAFQWLIILVIPASGIYLAHIAFKKLNDGYMSYSKGIGIGMLLSLVNGIIYVCFNYIYKSFIDPDLQVQILESTRAKLESEGKMSDAQIDQMMSLTAKFSTGPIGIAIGLILSLIFGLLISLVIAAITKNPKPEFE